MRALAVITIFACLAAVFQYFLQAAGMPVELSILLAVGIFGTLGGLLA